MADHPSIERLERLELFLREDPQNAILLADAFETALQLGKPDHAEFHLRHALALGLNDDLWRRYEAHLHLARHQWTEAQDVLTPLLAATNAAEPAAQGIAHDLAYAQWRGGLIDAAIASLEPWLPIPTHASVRTDPSLQAIWLRLMHHAGRLEEACDWVRAQISAHGISPLGLGVASLIALDLGDHSSCATWSGLALQQGGVCTEALVSAASIALMTPEASAARSHLQRALLLQPDDGRTWSALGFCELLEQRIDAARVSFVRALATMPGHIGTWHGLGWTELLARNLPAAQSAFESALCLDRNFGESYGGLAVVKALEGARVVAEEHVERALRLDRNSLSARYAQAVLQGRAHDADVLRQLASQVLYRSPLRP